MEYRVKFKAGFIIYTEWFSTLAEAKEVAQEMSYRGVNVLAIEDENYEVI